LGKKKPPFCPKSWGKSKLGFPEFFSPPKISPPPRPLGFGPLGFPSQWPGKKKKKTLAPLGGFLGVLGGKKPGPPGGGPFAPFFFGGSRRGPPPRGPPGPKKVKKIGPPRAKEKKNYRPKFFNISPWKKIGGARFSPPPFFKQFFGFFLGGAPPPPFALKKKKKNESSWVPPNQPP